MKEFHFHLPHQLKNDGITFDGSLPQGFYDQIYNLTGHNPMGNIVYAYPPQHEHGWPVATTQAGAVMLGAFDKANGTAYADGFYEEEEV